MICSYDLESHVWVAAGNGPMRPIVVEQGTRDDAIKAYGEAFLSQQNEEVRFARQYEQDAINTHFSDKAFENVFGAPGDLG